MYLAKKVSSTMQGTIKTYKTRILSPSYPLSMFKRKNRVGMKLLLILAGATQFFVDCLAKNMRL